MKKTNSIEKSTAEKAGDSKDITELMLEHHKPLKALIQAMKNEESSIRELKIAYMSFAPLLEAHAVPEQDSLYERMRDSAKLRTESFEGFTEHEMADQLAKKINGTPDDADFRAKVKVLAESVEHHIEEEERDMIPDIREAFSSAERAEIGLVYLALRSRYVNSQEVA